jgi:spore protease
MNIRTDLAVESVYTHHGNGVSEENLTVENLKITRIKITTAQAAEKVGKPVGNYVTIEGDNITKKEPEILENIAKILSHEIRRILPPGVDNILVVGLGNRRITPDSLGPSVIERVMVTNHIIKFLNTEKERDFSSVSGISPGVMGVTGMETVDIVKGIVDIARPSLIIAVDALCAKNAGRMFKTIQVTDTGINPGSGVGNRRDGLNKEKLGIPVIAIGIPTVVDANSIISDALTTFFQKNSELENGQEIINDILESSNSGLIVSPKDIDNLIERGAKIVANGINLALHNNIDFAFIEGFVC